MAEARNPIAIVVAANNASDITTSNTDTLPMETLTNMDIKELNGIKEAIFKTNPSGFCIPVIEIKNTATNNKVIGVELALISSVLDTNAPSAPKIKAYRRYPNIPKTEKVNSTSAGILKI